MNTIRTTVSLEQNLHRQLMTQAVSMGLSFNKIVNLRLANQNFGGRNVNYSADLALFARLGKKIKKTNWVKLVREERDQDE